MGGEYLCAEFVHVYQTLIQFRKYVILYIFKFKWRIIKICVLASHCSVRDTAVHYMRMGTHAADAFLSL